MSGKAYRAWKWICILTDGCRFCTAELALKGSLSNFAGGVLILIFKPFRIGDLVSTQGETGVVKEIHIPNSILLTLGSKTVLLLNRAVSIGTITNISKHANLRVDLKVTVNFTEGIKKARQIILEVLHKDSKVLKDPAPCVNILEYVESAIVLSVRPYAMASDYWEVFFNSYEAICSALV